MKKAVRVVGGSRVAKCLVTVVAMSMIDAAVAQVAPSVSPGAIGGQEQREREQREREQRLQEQIRTPQITTQGSRSTTPASEEKNIPVEKFVVDSSSLLSVEAIDKVLAPLRGKKVSLADLQRAVVAINALYDEKRQSTARAFLPPQTIKDGIVQIRLVESRVGKVKISGNKYLDQDYVARRLTLQSGDLTQIPVLEDDLVRFNKLNESQLRASVVAGEQFGTTDVDVTVQEPSRMRGSIFADNGGRSTVGSARAGFSARAANLAGISDTLQAAGTFSEGSKNYSLSYSLPVNRNDLRLDMSYSQGGIKIIDGPFQPLDITGSSSDATIGLTQPLMVTLADQWSVYGRFSARKSISKFGGFEQQNQDLRVWSFGGTGEHRSDKVSWIIDQFIGNGMKYWGGEENFTYYRGNATHMATLSDRWQMVTRGGWQLTDTRFLPASEQFQIGGMNSVRGFSEGLLSGRSGYFLSMEWRFGGGLKAYMERDASAPSFQGAIFIDHGGAFPYRAGNQKEVGRDDFLTGAGLGVLMDWKKLNVRAYVAHPINKNPAELDQKSPRAHVIATLSFD